MTTALLLIIECNYSLEKFYLDKGETILNPGVSKWR